MSKTLSNGVLSLRFMQNAQRAKQLKEVELQRAEIVDEGKWEVSQALRDAWGLTKERNEDEQDADVHEASYLPFLYSIPDEGSSEAQSQFTSGRRVFKHAALDVPDNGSEDTQGKDVPPTSAPNDSSKSSKGRIHAHPRPISLSSLSKGKGSLLKGFDQLSGSGHDESRYRKPKGKETPVPRSTAREMIFESGNVGVDLRVQASTKAPPRTFMKPAGVDDPKESVEPASSAAKKGGSEMEVEVIGGARKRLKKTKRDRDPDEADGEEVDVNKKPKKKKKKSAGPRG